MMPIKTYSFTALAYVLLTFPFAYAWHLVVFRSVYDRMGYLGDQEPIVALGLATIAAQGLLLAWAYPRFRRGGSATAETAQFMAVFGGFLFTTHVVAPAAKHHAPATLEWFLLEGSYVALHFALVGVAFAWIHRSRAEAPHAP